MEFEKLKTEKNLRQKVKDIFDIDLNISGGWGYTIEEPLEIRAVKSDLKQVENTLATIRSYLEMNILQPKETRYGGIKVSERLREEISYEGRILERVVYEVNGMLESDYADFIQEYKARQNEPDFDMTEHFERRKQKTLRREEVFFFAPLS